MLDQSEHAQLIYAQLIREYVRRQGDLRLEILGKSLTPTDYIPSVLVSHRDSLADTAHILAVAFAERANNRDF